jgi:hypothetical protein
MNIRLFFQKGYTLSSLHLLFLQVFFLRQRKEHLRLEGGKVYITAVWNLEMETSCQNVRILKKS